MTYDVKLYVWDGYVIEHYIFRFEIVCVNIFCKICMLGFEKKKKQVAMTFCWIDP